MWPIPAITTECDRSYLGVEARVVGKGQEVPGDHSEGHPLDPNRLQPPALESFVIEPVAGCDLSQLEIGPILDEVWVVVVPIVEVRVVIDRLLPLGRLPCLVDISMPVVLVEALLRLVVDIPSDLCVEVSVQGEPSPVELVDQSEVQIGLAITDLLYDPVPLLVGLDDRHPPLEGLIADGHGLAPLPIAPVAILSDCYGGAIVVDDEVLAICRVPFGWLGRAGVEPAPVHIRPGQALTPLHQAPSVGCGVAVPVPLGDLALRVVGDEGRGPRGPLALVEEGLEGQFIGAT